MDNVCINDYDLKLAIRAAKNAGKTAKSMKQAARSNMKSNDSIVTEADEKAERIIRQILEEHSDHQILGEEQGGDIDDDTYWVVDPIDGTFNYSYQNPLYGTAIGLVEDNEVTVGTFYMPEFEYSFYAVENNGAYRNQYELNLTGKTSVDKPLLGITGKGKEDIRQYMTSFSSRIPQYGSAVLLESWTASGWVDGGVVGALAPWDMVVGQILIREAGGVIKQVSSQKTTWDAVKHGRVVIGDEEIVDSVIDSFSEQAIKTIEDATYNY